MKIETSVYTAVTVAGAWCVMIGLGRISHAAHRALGWSQPAYSAPFVKVWNVIDPSYVSCLGLGVMALAMRDPLRRLLKERNSSE